MISSVPSCRLLTLGCKVNQYETQYVKETLELNGFREARGEEQADLCVVNTCTVTMEADAKSRQTIRRLHAENPKAAIVVMGCYATRDPATVSRLPGVTHVIKDKNRLAVELRLFGVQVIPAGIKRFDGHQRAFVKVQDGCVLNCTYCIIPSVRPVLRSRPAQEIVEEVRQLVGRGKREVVLTGIHLGHYGIDLSKGLPKARWTRLWKLIELLDRLPGDFRIRLSSLEAAESRDDLVSAIARSKRVVPHLHLCLQSGSDKVLARMRRRYRRASFVERCRRIQRDLDLPALTTDVIVGFPGETDSDFEETCDVCREVGFAGIHIFSWSPRAGTPAATFDHRVAPSVIAQRRERLKALAKDLAQDFRRRLLGRTLDVLVEGEDPRRMGHVVGTSCRQMSVSFEGWLPAILGKRVPVKVTQVTSDGLLGSPMPLEEDAGDEPTLDWLTSATAGGRISLPVTNEPET